MTCERTDHQRRIALSTVLDTTTDMNTAFLAQAIVFAFLATIAHAQPSLPAQGIQIGTPAGGWDIRFPLTVTQCEPVFIYYNNTISATYGGLGLETPDGTYLAYLGPLPLGVGYLEWVCNIPAGFGFVAYSSTFCPVVVQSGPLSSCLRDLSTTYQYASYSTANFATYTSTRPITTTSTVQSILLATYVDILTLSFTARLTFAQVNCLFPNRFFFAHNNYQVRTTSPPANIRNLLIYFSTVRS
jgi:hypothetical protein